MRTEGLRSAEHVAVRGGRNRRGLGHGHNSVAASWVQRVQGAYSALAACEGVRTVRHVLRPLVGGDGEGADGVV